MGYDLAMINIRPGMDEDKEGILALVAQVFGKEQAERAAKRWHWQWHADPRLESPGYRGVVAVWQDQVIANLACIPAGLYIEGEPVEAYWCVDVLTHWGLTRQALREYKRNRDAAGADLSRGIAAALLDHPSAGPIQLAKHIADPMKTIALRIGFKELPHSGNFSRRLSFRQSLRASVGALPGTLIAAVADLAVARIPRAKLAVERFDGPFGAQFDQFWSRIKGSYTAIALRDAATLNWRYHAHPDTRYIILVVPDNSEIRGYLVLSTFPRGPRLRADIVDLVTMPDDGRAIDDLVTTALRVARAEGADRIGCFATGIPLGTRIRRLGFEPRLKKSKKPQPLITRRLPVEDVYATAGDGDGG